MPANRAEALAAFHEILARSGVTYRFYQHKPVLSYDDAREVSAELELTGDEGKCVVCRAGDGYAVYVTTEGQRFDARALKRLLGVKKLRLASADELHHDFGAEPGAAYPFGFATDIPIVVDPAIYTMESLLFSSPAPTETLQIGGEALRRILESLPNRVLQAEPG